VHRKKLSAILNLALSLLLLSAIGHAQTSAPQISLPAKFPLPESDIQLARSARSTAYFDTIGRRAGLLGTESGRFESWIFPLKLFYSARITIAVEGQDRIVEFGERIERIIQRPESTTLVAADQFFTIKATFFSPTDEPSSIILLDIDTDRSLTLTVSFMPDLRPMWPAGFGGQTAIWRDDLKAFQLSESRRRYNGFFGSPAATRGISVPAHQLGEGSLRFDLSIDPALARRCFYPLYLTGGGDGRPATIERYQKIGDSLAERYNQTRSHYLRLQKDFLHLSSPDDVLNRAFEWAKVALDKGMIDNPELGLGLVAGWGLSGSGARPGFGWYFGGDMAINSLAMTGYGDFVSVRAALAFAAKYQRADGKIAHEVSQAAGQIRWFDEYPYAYYHADTTPLFIIAAHNLYRQTGDPEDVRQLWEVLKKAYQFCLDNDTDNDGILENSQAGLGASELGSLLTDLHQDIYLAATNIEASRAIAELSKTVNDDKLAQTALDRYQRGIKSLNERYFQPENGRFSYALTKDGRRNPEITSWSALPFVFDQFDRARVGPTLKTLASSELSTDWGTRMLSRRSRAYDPIAYNNGGVWPFLTGFVSLAEYRYDRPHSAFAHWRQLAVQTFDFALGSHPEILSGEFYRPLDESVPHQLFSSGMVITPFVRGLLGIIADAPKQRLQLTPKIPARWDAMRFENLRIGKTRVGMAYARRDYQHQRYEFTLDGGESLIIDFAPSLPQNARVINLTIDGTPSKCSAPSPNCRIEVRLHSKTVVEVTLAGGIEIDVPTTATQIGERSSALKLVEIRNREGGAVEIQTEGRPGMSYRIRCRADKLIRVVSGGEIDNEDSGWKVITVKIPAGSTDDYIGHQLTLQLEK
jgi:hypothetical protein